MGLLKWTDQTSTSMGIGMSTQLAISVFSAETCAEPIELQMVIIHAIIQLVDT